MTSLLKQIFPQTIVCVDNKNRQVSGTLFPEEKKLAARMSSVRQNEFACGRLLAHQAFNILGFKKFPLLQDQDHLPVWPQGLVGCITHTKGYCAAAVARKKDVLSIGIDAERINRVQPCLWKKICTPVELNQLTDDAASIQRCAVLFSAKESFYKCQFPLTRTWLGFQDVEIEIDEKNQKFTVIMKALLHSQLNQGGLIQGHYKICENIVLTGICFNDLA